ncbi:MAG: hypothetical protein IAI50_04750 [Candidatus Eremiobacteraeota bacterium]|nr:hypothetical protein [Candidatus Eremiobacteraeota bacterium]
MRSALDAALAPGRSPEEALRLTAALWRYWLIRNNLQEGRAALGAVLDRPAAAFPALRARNLIGLGSLHLQLRDFEAAWTCAREACGLAREAGDERSLVHALGVCLIAPSYYADPSDAERDSAELERRTSAMGDRWLAALPLFTNALRALRDADAQGANVFLERARAIVVTLGAPYDIAAVSCQLGFNRLELSDAGGAAEAFFEYVRHGAALNSRDLIGHCTDGLACVAVHTERMADAAELFGAGRAIRELMGGELWSHWRPVHERLRAAAFEALGDERFDERARVGYELARRDPFLPMRRFESAYGMPGGTTCATMALRTPEDVLPEVVAPEVAPVFSKSPL